MIDEGRRFPRSLSVFALLLHSDMAKKIHREHTQAFNPSLPFQRPRKKGRQGVYPTSERLGHTPTWQFEISEFLDNLGVGGHMTPAFGLMLSTLALRIARGVASWRSRQFNLLGNAFFTGLV